MNSLLGAKLSVWSHTVAAFDHFSPSAKSAQTTTVPNIANQGYEIHQYFTEIKSYQLGYNGTE